MLRYFRLLLVVGLLFGCNNQQKVPDKFAGRVVAVKDGDTMDVLVDEQTITVRLGQIDCPEKSQPFGMAAKKFTSALCYGMEVTVDCNPQPDPYNRRIAQVMVNGKSINKELVKNGYAWCYRYFATDPEFARLEKEARSGHRGLWVDNNPIEPWNWRKTHH